jgi:hypothetical protein
MHDCRPANPVAVALGPADQRIRLWPPRRARTPRAPGRRPPRGGLPRYAHDPLAFVAHAPPAAAPCLQLRGLLRRPAVAAAVAMQQQQLLALLLAVCGGISMGIYPAFIKTAAVLRVNVHPVVFQCYKSTMVFLTGFLFLIPRWLAVKHSDDPQQQLYVFSYWGVLSAVCWVPSGISTIFSVPRIGMGMTTAISAATASTLSFVVFWLVFGSKMKSYSCGVGCTYYRAPIFLAADVLGMFALIFAKDIARRCGLAPPPSEPFKSTIAQPVHPAIIAARKRLLPPADHLSGDHDGGPSINSPLLHDGGAGGGYGRWVAGICVSVSSGTFGAMQCVARGRCVKQWCACMPVRVHRDRSHHPHQSWITAASGGLWSGHVGTPSCSLVNEWPKKRLTAATTPRAARPRSRSSSTLSGAGWCRSGVSILESVHVD